MEKKPKPVNPEAYGMDARPGPSRLPQSYFDAVCPPHISKLMREAREIEKL